MMQDTRVLQDAGLTEGEAKVYLALLRSGTATSGYLVGRAGVSKSIVYPLLERLMQKGLVSCIVKDKTKHFEAAHPQKVLDYASEAAKHAQETQARIAQAMPALAAQYASLPRNQANFFLGFMGIRTAHEHMYAKLKKGDEYYYLGIPALQSKEHHAYWQRDHQRRAKAGIKCKLLFNSDTPTVVLKNRNGFPGCDARYMPEGIVTPAYILVYKDTVLIAAQYPEPAAVEIVNQVMAKSMKAYFDVFWRMSKQPKKGVP